jgi:hypothetical protein
MRLNLSGERNGWRSTERGGEFGEDHQVDVRPSPIKATNAKRGKRPLILESAGLPLD